MQKIIPNESVDSLMGFEDVVDIATMNDDQFNSALEETLAKAEIPKDEEKELDDIIDTDIDNNDIDYMYDYSNDIPESDNIAIDSDDLLAAERELMTDPNSDDELIDLAIGDDDINIETLSTDELDI